MFKYIQNIGKTPVICFSAFMIASALGLMNLGNIFHAREVLQASPAAIGWLPATWSLGYVIGCLTITPLLKRFAPHKLVTVSCFCLCITFWRMSLADSIGELIIYCLISGLTLTLYWPFLMGWLTVGFEGKALGRVISVYNLSWCSATVISPFICGWLSERSTRLPLQYAMLMALTSGIVLLFCVLLPNIRNDRTHLHEKEQASPLHQRTRLRFSGWLGLAATFFGIGVIAAVFPVSGQVDLRFSMFMIGSLLLVRALFQVLGFLLLGRSESWHFRSGLMLCGQTLAIAGFIGLMFAGGSIPVSIAMAACGAGAAMSYSYSMFHGVTGSSNRSLAMMIHEVLLAIGLMGGNILGGIVYEKTGMLPAYGMCAFFLAAALPPQIAIGRWCRHYEKRTDGSVTGMVSDA